MLTTHQRDRLATIADVLIPAAEGMPSATEADVPNTWIDHALGYRPDLAEGLAAALEAAGDLPADEAVEHLNSTQIPAFEALGTLLAGAYFLNPQIRELIGYPGQVATMPKDDTDTYVDLLMTVMERGPVYRDVPADVAER